MFIVNIPVSYTHLDVYKRQVTTTSAEYDDSFGFTEEEVFAALDEFKLGEQKQTVKEWYDGFTFGSQTDIYNPWSIINYLDTGELNVYWANTSSNKMCIRDSLKRINGVSAGSVFADETNAYYYKERRTGRKLSINNLSAGLKSFVIIKRLLEMCIRDSCSIV